MAMATKQQQQIQWQMCMTMRCGGNVRQPDDREKITCVFFSFHFYYY